MNICAGIISSLRQMEHDLMVDGRLSDPRHFVHPEWAIIVISGGDNDSCAHAFDRPPAQIRLDDSTLVLVPVNLYGSWACYAFHFAKRVLTVMDSQFTSAHDTAVIETHGNNAKILLDKVIYCMQRRTRNNSIGTGVWEKNLLTGDGGINIANSSLAALNYARWFNGTTVCDMFGNLQPKIAQNKKELLLLVIHNWRNQAVKPEFLKTDAEKQGLLTQ